MGELLDGFSAVCIMATDLPPPRLEAARVMVPTDAGH